jgi:hypothetical protein
MSGYERVQYAATAFAWGAVGTIVLIVLRNVLEVSFVRPRLFVSLQPAICTPFF